MKDVFRAWLMRLAFHLPILPRRQLLYRLLQGRWPRLRNPQLMTEKVNWRILFDRREVLAWTCDKLQMKIEVAKLAPELRIPNVLWSGEDVKELSSVELPERWVLKPNHRSGLVYMGNGPADLAELQQATSGWLDDLNLNRHGEWAYGQAQRTLFVEEALGDKGQPPADYKFYVFDGVVRLIQVDYGRFGDHTRRHYSPDWKPVTLNVDVREAELQPRPTSLDNMLDAASRIGAPFDFMRVDLYDWNDKVYLGEVTPYPASGRGRYDPHEVDVLMGSYWTLPSK